ncbi:MAG: thioredoxin domain-containing protein [Eubacteriales bacterium]|nr:thioredoxin domain-containing protein [Eubacteriales bacterium]MDD3200052.1 thioredoxin domain-containing protein [Eubacteriales bacterium]MDD4121706.1 thioredoxin domain-containing protein [Eubacteriales bacterium]MDD4630555.1 thioredoxin domain-containing protein [Eubacteriales bacterium]
MTNEKTNRLMHEKSPYLLQHAYNPVDWYPWGDEAFSKAKSEDKPIFLSIGYSTCHWCHVMAHESFEDHEVAEALNRDFVPIKVDKEERPDIDSVYMSVCQALTGSGGWPLTIIMTPDQKPFLAGTYYPKNRRYNVPGILEILEVAAQEWRTNKEDLLKTGDRIVTAIKHSEKRQNTGQIRETGNNADLSKKILHKAQDILSKSFDNRYGGFGQSPKFPSPHNLMFLLRYYKLEKENRALEMVEKTLQQMYRGGIFDHIGYGFSRYSTDEKWLAPHFEKMLYDNALLTMIYLETYQITGKELYKSIAIKTMRYITGEMTAEEGGFFSAQDADSEGSEGKYYVFSDEEIIDFLGKEDGEAFNEYYDITPKGNFEGSNIPNLINNANYDPIPEKIQALIPKVYNYRLRRMMLHKDDKLLTSWNALMIAAFAKAYKALDDVKYLRSAERAAAFIEENMTGEDGKLHVSYREGSASGTGNLNDYAFTIWALLELYEASMSINYLEKARKLCDLMLKGFLDEEGEGFYLIDKEAEQLIYRPKETYDGAMPSGNSAAGYVLIKLGKLTGMEEYRMRGLQQLRFLSQHAAAYPAGYCFAMMAIMMELYQESFLCENGICS